MTKLHLIELDIDAVEEAFECNLRRGCMSLGLDTATKSGWSLIKTSKTKLNLSVGFINVDVKGIKDKKKRNMLRYEAIYKHLKNLLKKEYITVIEDVYFGRNVNTTIVLARIGAIAWTLAKEIGVKETTWINASSARKKLGIKGNAKKEQVMEALNTRLGINLTNNDEADAVILALVGLLKEE